MVDLIDAVNFLEIQNTKGGNRNEARLRDLEGKAKFLAKQTGQEPVSWYEFTRAVPPEKPNYLSNAAIGAGLGGLALASVAAVAALPFTPVVVSGVIVGGLLGGYHKTENTSRAHQVDAYEQYLNQFEASGLGIQRKMDGLNMEFHPQENAQTQFAETLKNEREANKTACGCKGK
jgi:hypothetical protein